MFHYLVFYVNKIVMHDCFIFYHLFYNCNALSTIVLISESKV